MGCSCLFMCFDILYLLSIDGYSYASLPRPCASLLAHHMTVEQRVSYKSSTPAKLKSTHTGCYSLFMCFDILYLLSIDGYSYASLPRPCASLLAHHMTVEQRVSYKSSTPAKLKSTHMGCYSLAGVDGFEPTK